jgi:hypothetical protein
MGVVRDRGSAPQLNLGVFVVRSAQHDPERGRRAGVPRLSCSESSACTLTWPHGYGYVLGHEIDESAWSTLYTTLSRPFAPPETGRIAVKVINHCGDELLKVFSLET